jgi:hypothetical protein
MRSNYLSRFGLQQQMAVKIVGVYVVITYIVMEILYFGVWCRPISGYWQVPVENSKYRSSNIKYVTDHPSSMLSCNTPSHHQCGLQHFFRSHDDGNSFASPYHISSSSPEVS